MHVNTSKCNILLYLILQDVLEDMRQLMCKQCRALNENPMLPNISQLKGLMLKVSLKWDKLVKQATPIDVSMSYLFLPFFH